MQEMKDPNPIDIHVGRRVRLRRKELGISQERLAEGLGLTFQQVQKYERGANRISASRLWDLSQILDVPVSYFLDDMSKATMKSSPQRVARGADAGDREGGDLKDPMARCETLELVRAYYTIKQPTVRKRVSDMVKSIALTLAGD